MIIKNRRCFLGKIRRRFWPFSQFYLIVALSCTSVFAAKPFTFDPFTLKIYNVPDSSDVNPSNPYAVACPAQNETEKYVNENESIDHKALFVRQYYGVGERALGHVTCTKKFEMAAIFDRNDYVIEFGYEIYFVYDTAPKKILVSDYINYGPISKADSTWKRAGNVMKQIYLYDNVGRQLGFTWIPVITLRYSTTQWSFISSEYVIYCNVAKELTIKCDNYNLGHTFFEEKDGPFDQFYLPDTQKNIFSLVKLPELPEDSVCKTTGECVKKYDFLRPYLYRSSYESPVSCSNLTTIPIWYEVAEELLNNLEIFLFALGQVTQNPLTILPGVYNTLSFMTNDTRKPKPMTIYLYTKQKRISVPKILYKIVRYQSHNCKENVELCWFDIVIVIHNHPGSVKKHMICPKDKCKEYGWEKIKFVNRPKEGNGSEHIYCCKLDEKMQKILRFEIGDQVRDDLNLKDFPVYDEKRGENRYVDRQDEFETQMSKLSIEILEELKTKL